MKRDIIFYESESGSCPVIKFLGKLSAPEKDKVAIALEHISTAQFPASHLFCKMVNTQDLWEIRIRHNTNIYRLLCFFDGKTVIVAAHAFQKKTQKTPAQEIRTAQQRRKDYLRRKL